MAELKRDYILSIGGIPLRTVLMGLSTGAAYLILREQSHTLIAKSRNFALLFLLNGLFWVP
jgi:hypothetical protein